MAQRRPQKGCFAKGRRKRFGRNWWDNPVATGYYDKSRSAQSLGAHELAPDPPQTSARFVVSVPRTRTAVGYPDRQGDSIVDPVLKGYEAASSVAIGVEMCKTNKFAYSDEGIEDIEQRLNRLDRQIADRIAAASETVGCNGKALALRTFNMEVPRRREQRKTGDFTLAA